MTSARISRVWGIILLTITIFSLSLPAYAQYSGGTGEPNDPYQIATAEDLMLLGETPEDYDKCFIMTADIDLDPNLPGRRIFDKAVIAPDINNSEESFQGTVFSGVFDGNGHIISHLTITGGDYIGLFGQMGRLRMDPVPLSGKIKNLGIVAINIVCSGDYVGALVGNNMLGSVTNCYSVGAVSGKDYVGGLVGSVGARLWLRSTVSHCYSTVAVSGDSSVGGLVGRNDGTVTQCYSTGAVSGASDVGGFVGLNKYRYFESGGVVTMCFWDTQTSSQTKSAGGTGATTAEMKTVRTFLRWGTCGNEGIWTIDEGNDYPHLAWERRPGVLLDFRLSDFLDGNGTEDDPYLIYTVYDIETIASFPCEQVNSFRLMFVEGLGTQDSPYLLTTAEQLNMIGMLQGEWNKHYKLMSDIDLSAFDGKDGNLAFKGIGTFVGVFDGNGHTISHLTISGGSYLGLFGQLASGAEVRNLGVVDANIIGLGDYPVGGLVGKNHYGIVISCYSTGTVRGTDSVGGLVGDNYEGSITQCYSTSKVNGDKYVGGLAGNNGGHITTCWSTGEVRGTTSYVGGLVGWEERNGSVLYGVWDVETSGLLESAGGVGLTTAEMVDPYMLGLNGFANNPNWVLDKGRDYPRLAWEDTPGLIIPQPKIDWLEGLGTKETPYRIDTAGQMVLLGKAPILWSQYFVLREDIDLDPNLSSGQVFAQSVIQTFEGVFDGSGHSVSHLTVTGYSKLGLFGRLQSGAEVKNLDLVDVNILGVRNIGGLVGLNSSGTITNCSSSGAVNRRSEGIGVGGLIGINYGTVFQCYSTVVTSGYGGVGGLIGTNYGAVFQCYSTGAVSADRTVGGLIGSNGGIVTQCYSTGKVGGDINVGGLIGYRIEWTIAPTQCFWDTQTSGQPASSGGRGKTTAEMQTAQTFLEAGWDFMDETANGTEDIWWILEGQDYPRLWWENAEE